MKFKKKFFILLIAFVFMLDSLSLLKPALIAFAYPNTETEFYDYVEMLGYPVTLSNGKKANWTVYQTYNQIIWGSPYGRHKTGSMCGNDSEYEYLGYNVKNVGVTNTCFPNDADAPGHPRDWNFISVDGEKSWDAIKQNAPEVASHIKNSDWTGNGATASDPLRYSDVGSEAKTKIQVVPTWRGQGSVYTKHKTSSGKIWYATFVVPSMAGDNKALVDGDLTTDKDTYTIQSDQDSVSGTLSVNAEALISGYMKYAHISELKAAYKSKSAKTSGEHYATLDTSLKFDRKTYKVGTHTINLEGTVSIKSKFGDSESKKVFKKITLIVEKADKPSITAWGFTNPDNKVFPKGSTLSDVPVTVTVNGELTGVDPKNITKYELLARKETDAQTLSKVFTGTAAQSLDQSNDFDFTVSKSLFTDKTYTQNFIITAKAYLKNGTTVSANDIVATVITPPNVDPPAPPAPPPSDPVIMNEPPTVTILGPTTVKAGDYFYLNSTSSDSDGTIVAQDWNTPGAGDPVTGSGGLTYYMNEGTNYVDTTVYDDQGATGYDSHEIQVVPPYPEANFTVGGTLKENRKVDIQDTSSSPTFYPIDWSQSFWEITPVDAANQQAIKIKGNLDGADMSKTLETLYKTPGQYKISLFVKNTAGLSDSIEKTITIEPDLKPTADFDAVTTTYRDANNNNQATLKLTDSSFSEDDTIGKRIWTYRFDSNNDGNFTDEQENVIDDTNLLAVDFPVTHVGKYLIELKSIEEFGQPTIDEFVTPDDRKRDDTSDKVMAEKVIEVKNLAPVVSFQVGQKKKVSLNLEIGNTQYTDVNMLTSKINSIVKPELDQENIDLDLTVNKRATPLNQMQKGSIIKFAGYEWLLLDPSKGYVIMNGNIGTKSFDLMNNQNFNPTNSNNIAYYLNNTWFNGLPSTDKAVITSHTWNIGNQVNEAAKTVDANVGLLSNSEWIKYSQKQAGSNGVIPDPSSVFWTITPYSGDTSQVIYVGVGGIGNSNYAGIAFDIRPTLYLNTKAAILSNGSVNGLLPTWNTTDSSINNFKAEIDDASLSSSVQNQLINDTTNNNINVIGLGTTTNKNDFQSIFNTVHKGAFIDNSNLDTAIQQMADYILEQMTKTKVDINFAIGNSDLTQAQIQSKYNSIVLPKLNQEGIDVENLYFSKAYLDQTGPVESKILQNDYANNQNTVVRSFNPGLMNQVTMDWLGNSLKFNIRYDNSGGGFTPVTVNLNPNERYYIEIQYSPFFDGTTRNLLEDKFYFKGGSIPDTNGKYPITELTQVSNNFDNTDSGQISKGYLALQGYSTPWFENYSIKVYKLNKPPALSLNVNNNQTFAAVIENNQLGTEGKNLLLSEATKKDVDVIGLGKDATNKTQFEEINASLGNGMYQDNTDMDAAMNKMADHIIEEVNKKLSANEVYLTLDEAATYFTYYNDAENDPKYTLNGNTGERWKYSHDPSVFENPMGTYEKNNQYQDAPVTQFTKTGVYQVTHSERDNPVNAEDPFDNYRLWSKEIDNYKIFVHRKPVPDFGFTINSSTGDYTLTNKAYDLDKLSVNIGNGGGIRALNYQWREKGTDLWNDGLPPSPLSRKVYEVKQEVFDFQGASAYAIKAMDATGVNKPPIADFDPIPPVIFEKDTVKLQNKSTDPNGDPLTYQWYMKKDGDATWQPFSTVENPTQQLNTVGKYWFKVKATDPYSASAESVEKEVNVILKNQPPKAGFTYKTPQYIGDTIVLKSTAVDPDGNPLTYVYSVSKQNGSIATYKTGDPEVNDQGDLTLKADNLNTDLGIWSISQVVSDGTAFDTANADIEVLNQVVTGQVSHTAKWEENRQKFNLKSSGDANSPRGPTVFFPGEKFVLQANATETATDVVVTIKEYPQFSTRLTKNGLIWEGSLWDSTMLNLFKNEELNFEFFSTHLNGWISHDSVKVQIQDDPYWRQHTTF